MRKKDLNPKNYNLTPDVSANLDDLCQRVNLLEMLYGKPFVVTSGLRSKADQMRINPKAPNSKHVLGCAVDISDPRKELQNWLIKNVEALTDAELWCEHFDATPTWVHFQSIAPGSGKRFFKP